MDDDPDHAELLDRSLQKAGVSKVYSVIDENFLLEELSKGYDILFLNTQLNGDLKGFDLVETIRGLYHQLMIVGTSVRPDYEPSWREKDAHFIDKSRLGGDESYLKSVIYKSLRDKVLLKQ